MGDAQVSQIAAKYLKVWPLAILCAFTASSPATSPATASSVHKFDGCRAAIGARGEIRGQEAIRNALLEELATLRVSIGDAQKSGLHAVALTLSKEYQKKLVEAERLQFSLDQLPEYINALRNQNDVSSAAELDRMRAAALKERNRGMGKSRLILQHHDIVHTAEFSPDGNQVITASDDGAAIIWDANTGQSKLELIPDTRLVSGGTFSPNGKVAATAGGDGNVIMWDTETGKRVRTIKAHSNNVMTVKFSPNGKLLATASAGDGLVSLWSVATGKKLRTFKLEYAPWDIGFSPDSKRFVALDATVGIVFDVRTGARLLEAPSYPSERRRASFSPDSSRVFLIDAQSSHIQIWDIKKKTFVESDADRLTYPLMSPDGATVAGLNSAGQALIIDSKTGRTLHTLTHGGKQLRNAQFSPDSKRLIVTTNDNTAVVWNIAEEIVLQEIAVTDDVLKSATFDVSGEKILVVQQSRAVIYVPVERDLAE